MSLKNLIESSSNSMSIKAESMTPPASYTVNGLVAGWGALTFNESMMLIGTVLALATFGVNLYFQRRRDKREQELHKARMDRAHPEPHDDTH